MRQLYIQWVDFNWRKRSRVNRPPGSFSEIWNHFVSSPFTEVLIASIYFFSGICQFAISCCKRFVPRNQKRHFCRLSLPFSCEKKKFFSLSGSHVCSLYAFDDTQTQSHCHIWTTVVMCRSVRYRAMIKNLAHVLRMFERMRNQHKWCRFE